MRILFAAAEMSPMVRTGGLGEAVAGLAKALADAGHEVTVALPGYADAGLLGSKQRGRPWRMADAGPLRIATFQDALFDRPGVYGPSPGASYEDNWRRFAVFASAVAELEEGYDLVHLHDAHVGPAALLVTAPVVFTIHNASYPLLGPLDEVASVLHLGDAATALGGPLEWFGEANFLKAGIAGADQVTTVSPTHASELARDETSFGIGGLVRSLPRPIVGILNGIDTAAWDPASDGELSVPYTAATAVRRSRNRRTLGLELGLGDGFLFGNVGRMSAQKGLGLLDYDIDELVAEGLRFAFVGAGELDAVVDGWAARHPTAVAHRPYSEALARRIYGGVDGYVMPSEYEPCGLGQIYAMRYGAIPVAHAVGGLADTVVDVDEDAARGTGFVFRTFAHPSLTKTIRRAVRYHDVLPDVWEATRRNGMTADWSWDARAADYVACYESVLGDVRP